jgi:colanic acid/amylovoran biosynthesis protein
MHSNIFAMSQNVPVIAIGYLHKTLGIAEMVGIGEWVIDIQSVVGDLLIDTLDKLSSNTDAVKMNLAKTIPTLIQESRIAGRLIAEDYASINKKNNAR